MRIPAHSLSRKAGESFNYGCGALFAHAEIREDMIYDIILNTLTGQLSKALNRALDIIYQASGEKPAFKCSAANSNRSAVRFKVSA